MNSFAKTLVAGCGAIIIGAGAVWLTAAKARQSADAALAGMHAKNAALKRVVESAELRLANAERSRQEAQTAPRSLAQPKNTPATSAGTPSAVPKTLSEVISDRPHLEALEMSRQRWAFRADYDHLFHLLGLTPDQTAKFEALHANYTERFMDLRAAGRSQNEAGRQTVAELQKQAKAQHDEALKELLGPDGFRRMEEYDRTLPLRNVVVRAFAGAAALEGIPLTADQGEKMMRALMAAGGEDVSGPDQDLSGIDWDAFDRQVGHILSPAQLQLFQTVAPETGFSSRWDARLKAEIRRAHQADAATKVN